MEHRTAQGNISPQRALYEIVSQILAEQRDHKSRHKSTGFGESHQRRAFYFTFSILRFVVENVK